MKAIWLRLAASAVLAFFGLISFVNFYYHLASAPSQCSFSYVSYFGHYAIGDISAMIAAVLFGAALVIAYLSQDKPKIVVARLNIIIAVQIILLAFTFLNSILIVDFQFSGCEIQSAVRDIISKQAETNAPYTSEILEFGSQSVLAPSALVGNSGLSPDQICLHKGDLIDNQNLKIQGKTLANTGTIDLQIKVSVTCNYSKDIVASLEEIGFEELKWDNIDGFCQCDIENKESNQRCCAVILRYA